MLVRKEIWHDSGATWIKNFMNHCNGVMNIHSSIASSSDSVRQKNISKIYQTALMLVQHILSENVLCFIHILFTKHFLSNFENMNPYLCFDGSRAVMYCAYWEEITGPICLLLQLHIVRLFRFRFQGNVRQLFDLYLHIFFFFLSIHLQCCIPNILHNKTRHTSLPQSI